MCISMITASAYSQQLFLLRLVLLHGPDIVLGNLNVLLCAVSKGFEIATVKGVDRPEYT